MLVRGEGSGVFPCSHQPHEGAVDSVREEGEEQVNILVKRLEGLGVSNSAEQIITFMGIFCELVMKPLAA